MRIRRLAIALLLLAHSAPLPPHDPRPRGQDARSAAATGFLRGMVVSCPRAGQIWGSSEMAVSLRELSRLGVEWVAIHPYARVSRDGSIRWRPAAETGYLPRAVEIAQEAGIDLFWKPHLAYWGSFSWRGEIAFGADQAAWRRYFEGYGDFIVDQARFAERSGVRLLAVGVETEGTTHREADWRRVIRRVREVYSGRITYAANWDSLDRIPFWDAVDLIGVHAYFPLSELDDPDESALRRGWDGPLSELADLSHRWEKPILIAEIGYNRSPHAARAPWSHRTIDSPGSRRLRRRLIEVAAQRLEASSFIEGLFWWKWIPGPARFDRDFSMKDPEVRAALARAWGDHRRPEQRLPVTGE